MEGWKGRKEGRKEGREVKTRSPCSIYRPGLSICPALRPRYPVSHPTAAMHAGTTCVFDLVHVALEKFFGAMKHVWYSHILYLLKMAWGSFKSCYCCYELTKRLTRSLRAFAISLDQDQAHEREQGKSGELGSAPFRKNVHYVINTKYR